MDEFIFDGQDLASSDLSSHLLSSVRLDFGGGADAVQHSFVEKDIAIATLQEESNNFFQCVAAVFLVDKADIVSTDSPNEKSTMNPTRIFSSRTSFPSRLRLPQLLHMVSIIFSRSSRRISSRSSSMKLTEKSVSPFLLSFSLRGR